MRRVKYLGKLCALVLGSAGVVVLVMTGFNNGALARDNDDIDSLLRELEKDKILYSSDFRKLFSYPSDKQKVILKKPFSKHTGEFPLRGGCAKIEDIQVEGVTEFSDYQISLITQGYEQECISGEDIQEILKQLTTLYVDGGYITSRAYVPRQNLQSSNRLNIRVIEGRIEKITFNGDAEALELKTLFPDYEGRVLNLRELEHGMETLNRLDSYKAEMAIKPGNREGSSVVVITSEQVKSSVKARVMVDNFGDEAIGEFNHMATVTGNNSLGLNDIWSLSFNWGTQDSPFNFGNDDNYNQTIQGLISVPYEKYNFDFFFNHTTYHSKAMLNNTVLNTNGDLTNISLGASRLLHRNKKSKTSVSARLEYKKGDYYLLDTRLVTQSGVISKAVLGVEHATLFGGGQWKFAGYFHHGLPIFGAGSAAGDNVDTEYQFNKLVSSVEASYVKELESGIRVAYIPEILLQWSGDNLPGSEKMSLGGYGSVRGVTNGAKLGNNGIRWRNELAFIWPEMPFYWGEGISVIPSVFGTLDTGYVAEQSEYGVDGGGVAGMTIGARARINDVSMELSLGGQIAGDRPASADGLNAYGRIIYNFE